MATPLIPNSCTKSPALNVGITMERAINNPIKIVTPCANLPNTNPRFRAERRLRVNRLTSALILLATNKNIRKTINAKAILGSKAMKPLIML